MVGGGSAAVEQASSAKQTLPVDRRLGDFIRCSSLLHAGSALDHAGEKGLRTQLFFVRKTAGPISFE